MPGCVCPENERSSARDDEQDSFKRTGIAWPNGRSVWAIIACRHECYQVDTPGAVFVVVSSSSGSILVVWMGLEEIFGLDRCRKSGWKQHGEGKGSRAESGLEPSLKQSRLTGGDIRMGQWQINQSWIIPLCC